MAQTMRIGFLLSTGCERQDASAVSRLARAARRQGHEVKLFVMGDGVHQLVDHPKNPWAQEWIELLSNGVEIACCATSCEPRGISKEQLIPGVISGSQYDHAAIVHWSDRYLAFGS